MLHQLPTLILATFLLNTRFSLVSSTCTNCEIVVFAGVCDAFQEKTDCWHDIEYIDPTDNSTSTESVCCAVHASDCCEDEGASVAGLVILILFMSALVCLCCFAAAHKPTRNRVRYYIVPDNQAEYESTPILVQGIPVDAQTGYPVPHQAGQPQPNIPQPIAPQPFDIQAPDPAPTQYGTSGTTSSS